MTWPWSSPPPRSDRLLTVAAAAGSLLTGVSHPRLGGDSQSRDLLLTLVVVHHPRVRRRSRYLYNRPGRSFVRPPARPWRERGGKKPVGSRTASYTCRCVDPRRPYAVVSLAARIGSPSVWRRRFAQANMAITYVRSRISSSVSPCRRSGARSAGSMLCGSRVNFTA